MLDTAGNINETTIYGGAADGGGLFEFLPADGGAWTETTLHIFTGGSDGIYPEGGPVLDNARNLYGTTLRGGTFNDGIAWKITP
ncbi:MAG: hypothetical protein H0X25_07935 [Acidobacteriales bacterium]|nr:hypothetical protein [Terriglobales bacterium]